MKYRFRAVLAVSAVATAAACSTPGTPELEAFNASPVPACYDRSTQPQTPSSTATSTFAPSAARPSPSTRSWDTCA